MKTASSEQFMYTTCSKSVLNLQFSFTELVTQGTLFCHINARISGSEKDLPVCHS